MVLPEVIISVIESVKFMSLSVVTIRTANVKTVITFIVTRNFMFGFSFDKVSFKKQFFNEKVLQRNYLIN